MLGKRCRISFGVKYRYRIGVDDWQIILVMMLTPNDPFQMEVDPINFAPVHTATVSAFAMDKWKMSIELW